MSGIGAIEDEMGLSYRYPSRLPSCTYFADIKMQNDIAAPNTAVRVDQASQKLASGIKYAQKQPQSSLPILSEQSPEPQHDDSVGTVTALLRGKGLSEQQCVRYAAIAGGSEEMAEYLLQEGIPKITPSILSEQWIKNPIEAAFFQPQLFAKSKQKMKKSEKFFDFVMGKLTKDNKNLEFLNGKRREILNYIYEVQPPMPEEECLKLERGLQKYRNGEIVKQLQMLGVPEAAAETIAQISENNINRAVQLALRGDLSRLSFSIPSLSTSEDECVFLHRWVTHPSRHLLLLRLASSEELDLYTLSLRHCCRALYEIFLRHRRYLQKVIRESRPQIYSVKV